MDDEIAHDRLEMVEYRESPPVHVFGDSDAALERMRRAAAAADCRVLDAILIGHAAEPFAACAGHAPILIEVESETAGDGLLSLLDRVQSDAEAGRRRSVVSAPFALVDLVAARTPHGDVVQLCAAGLGERAQAVAFASRRRRERFSDIGREDGSLTLQRLSEDVGRIAAILASLSEEEAASAEPAHGAPQADEPGVDAAFIRAMIRARRMRDQFFRGDLFADPAWDMLLDLMAARLEKNRVAVSSLCIAAAVPATTALRWIKALTDRGLFVRQADPQDGRRVYIELSDETARALGAYLRAVQRLSTSAV